MIWKSVSCTFSLISVIAGLYIHWTTFTVCVSVLNDFYKVPKDTDSHNTESYNINANL